MVLVRYRKVPSLSPKMVGPIVHNQQGLPVALTLEGFHQFNKVFIFELDAKGNLTPEFFERQKFGYACQPGQAPRHTRSKLLAQERLWTNQRRTSEIHQR